MANWIGIYQVYYIFGYWNLPPSRCNDCDNLKKCLSQNLFVLYIDERELLICYASMFSQCDNLKKYICQNLFVLYIAERKLPNATLERSHTVTLLDLRIACNHVSMENFLYAVVPCKKIPMHASIFPCCVLSYLSWNTAGGGDSI